MNFVDLNVFSNPKYHPFLIRTLKMIQHANVRWNKYIIFHDSIKQYYVYVFWFLIWWSRCFENKFYLSLFILLHMYVCSVARSLVMGRERNRARERKLTSNLSVCLLPSWAQQPTKQTSIIYTLCCRPHRCLLGNSLGVFSPLSLFNWFGVSVKTNDVESRWRRFLR